MDTRSNTSRGIEPTVGVNSPLRRSPAHRDWIWRDLAASAARHPAAARLGAMAALARIAAVRPGEMVLLATGDVRMKRAGQVTVCRRPQHGYSGIEFGSLRRYTFWADEPSRLMLMLWEQARAELVGQLAGGTVAAYLVTTRRSRDTRPAGLPVTSHALERSWRRYTHDVTRTTAWQTQFPGQPLSPRFEAMRKAW